MFRIGEFSKISNTTVRALHHYEEMKILKPEWIDSQTGYRYYSAKQLPTINEIKALQQIGFSLQMIKEIIQNNQLDLLEYYYNQRERELQDEQDEIERKKNILALLQKQMKEGNSMDKYNVIIKDIPEHNVISIRSVMKSYDDEKFLWEKINVECQKQNIKINNPSYASTIYHDEEYKDNNIDAEMQMSVIGNYQDTDEIKFFKTPSLHLASATFNGPYEQIPQVTNAIASWVEANKYTITGPMVTIYHVSPFQDQNPENWVTEAGFGVKA